MFRDQSSHISMKFRGRNLSNSGNQGATSTAKALCSRPKSTVSTQAKNATSSDSGLLRLTQSQGDVEPQQAFSLACSSSIVVPIEDRAISFFQTNFIFGNSRAFRYLKSYYQHGPMDKHLAVSIRAVGLASLSKAVQSTELVNCGRRAYVLALRLTNAALQSSDAAKRDSTLSAILLLDLFEKISHPQQRSLESWTDHMNGAAALMKLRGNEQFQSHVGLEMFIQMSSHMLLTCMQRGIPLPEDYLTLRAYAATFLDTTDASWRLSEITVRYISFRVGVKDGSISGSEAIITAASQLDYYMQALLEDTPPEWQYETVLLDMDSELVYESYYDLYSDYRVAEVLNMIRAGRVPILEIIQEECEKAASSYEALFMLFDPTEQFQLSVKNFEKMTSEICASIPQQAGYLTWLTDLTTSRPSAGRIRKPSAYVAGAYSVLWPLFIIGHSPLSPHPVRAWVICQLHVIGASLGINEATEIAGILESGEDIDIWTVYSMLGSICYLSDES
jgi:hypothetical protein